MTTESTESTHTQHGHPKIQVIHHGGGSGNVYGIGMIGAWAYYFKGVTTFRQGVEAFGKGLVWPAYLVYELFMFLNKK